MSNYDGGPAFPVTVPHMTAGMTLRDYFAAQALSSFTTLKNPHRLAVNIQWTAAEIAARCYEAADAMLEARKVQP